MTQDSYFVCVCVCVCARGGEGVLVARIEVADQQADTQTLT